MCSVLGISVMGYNDIVGSSRLHRRRQARHGPRARSKTVRCFETNCRISLGSWSREGPEQEKGMFAKGMAFNPKQSC